MKRNSRIIDHKEDVYTTPEMKTGIFHRLLPTLSFYMMATSVVVKGSRAALRGQYGMERWSQDSQDIATAAEAVGGRIRIDGLDNFRTLEGPCVIIANHMSTLETFLIPGILQPIKDITFIVKRSLLEYPVFKHVMRASMPITVGRVNPREDLKDVFEQGGKMLSGGRSVVVFPQTTRSDVFDPERFNSIGAKLASRAGVPIIPMALYTAFWSNGRILKDYGTIHPDRKIRFSLGKPIYIEGKGTREHQEVVDFIKAKLDSWAAEDGR